MAFRVAVIGGGISGLAAAHRLIELAGASDRSVDVTLYESSRQAGGVFGTETVDGYRLELGADSFITDKPWGVDLCRRLGLEDQLVPPDPRYRRSLILHRGRPVPTPEAFQLMAPGKLRPILTTPLLSPLGKLRLLCEPFIPRRQGTDDETLAAFVRRRLGHEALERIVQPLVGGIYTGDPSQLSLLATFPRFRDMEQQWGSLWRGMRASRQRVKTDSSNEASGARYGLFVSLRRGMGELQRVLRERVTASASLKTGTRAERIVIAPPDQPRRFRVIIAGDHSSSDDLYDSVIIATPSYIAADLLADDRPDLSGPLRKIDYASSAIVLTGHRLADIEHPLDAYGLVIPEVERRRILAVSFLSRKFPDAAPEGRAILRTFVGGAMHPEMTSLSDEELLKVVRDELREILGVRGEPEMARVMRYERAMPQYHVGHLDLISEIESLTRLTSGLFLCGNAYRGVGLPDCIHQAESAAEGAWQTVTGSAHQR